MSWCSCNVAAEFLKDAASQNLGIISATLNTNTNFTVDAADGLVMYGPTQGDLSITAYAIQDWPMSLKGCPGRAQTSITWTQKTSCDNGFATYFIPVGFSKSFMEGDVTTKIGMKVTGERGVYKNFNASAASGPASPSLLITHRDGYNMTYDSPLIPITTDSRLESTEVGFLKSILPVGSKLYLTNFTWTHDPPNVPTVGYSFIFIYDWNK